MIQALRTFRPYAARYRGMLLLGAALAVAEVIVRLAEPWPLRIVVDHVVSADRTPVIGIRDRSGVLLLAVALLLVVVGLAAGLDYWSSRLLSTAGLRMSADVRGVVFSHLHRLSLGYHGQQRVGDLSTRVTSDVDRAQDMIVQSLAVIAPNVMLVVGMFGVMLVMDPAFTLVALALTPVLAFAVHRSTVQLKASSRMARKADGQVAAAATESLGLMNLVQLFTLERSQRARFDELTRSSLDAGLESARVQARFSPMVDLTAALSAAVVLWFGAGRVIDGQITLGALLVFVSYLGTLYKPLKALSRVSTTFAKGAAASERVHEVLSAVPEIRDHSGALDARRLRGNVEFCDVHFDYGGEPVLRGIDLAVPAGETLALVGATGAGKSTLVSLIPRLVDVGSGSVRVDALDVRSYGVESLRSEVAMVLQDCVLLGAPVADNIRVGRRGAPAAVVAGGARLALVDEFADRLPDGLDTMVGERGASLSGGQRQRVSIARAILRDAPILILDEPTSALDGRSEAALVEAISNLPAGRTTFIVAHRLSTIRRADRVAVLEAGRIVQLGTPDELAAVPGPFRDLADAGDRTPAGGGRS